jgi:hypothetical protein
MLVMLYIIGLIRHLSYQKALALQFNLSARVITQKVQRRLPETAFVSATSMLKFLPERQEN